MPGRPLKGSLTVNGDGTVRISIPLRRGDRARRYETFSDQASAERWRADAIAALELGTEPPDADLYRTRQRRAEDTRPGNFGSVALAWWERSYPPGGQRADAATAMERLDDINRHLIPFFGPRLDHISDMTAEDVEDFLAHKAGGLPSATTPHLQVVPDRTYTLQEASEAFGRSKSVLRRAYLAKRFPNATKDMSQGRDGLVQIPGSDLVAAGYSLVKAERPFGYSVRTVRGHLGTLRRIVAYARRTGLMTHDPTDGLSATPPSPHARTSRVTRRAEIKTIGLQDSQAVARQMHIHHQMAFWIMRVGGLRISEAFGLRLQDVVYKNDSMYLKIRRQGGKQFKVWNAEGGIETTTVKSSLKTKSSQRELPVPEQLAHLISTYVEAFHATNDPEASLIIGRRGSSQSTFRTALNQAMAVCGYRSDDLGFTVSAHYLRHCLSTDLAGMRNGVARSAYLGHKAKAGDGASPLTEGVYTHLKIDDSDVAVAFSYLTELIDKTIGQLVLPASPIRLLGLSNRRPLEESSDLVSIFELAGMIGSEVDAEGAEIITLPEAAELLGVRPTYIDHLAREGQLDRRRVLGAGRTAIWGVTAESVKAFIDIRQGSWTVRRICDEFELDKMTARNLLTRLEIKPLPGNSTNVLHYSADDVEVIREHLQHLSEVEERSVSISAAAGMLKVNRMTVIRLLDAGLLELDQEASALTRLQMLTRASVDARSKAHKSKLMKDPHPQGFTTFSEAKKRTGLGRNALMALSREGVKISRSAAYQFYFEEASLEAWIKRQK